MSYYTSDTVSEEVSTTGDAGRYAQEQARSLSIVISYP